MGKLLIDSINLLDRPVIVAYLLVIVTLFIVINLVVDLLYSALDPRVRLTRDARAEHAMPSRRADPPRAADARRAETPLRARSQRLRRQSGSPSFGLALLAA